MLHNFLIPYAQLKILVQAVVMPLSEIQKHICEKYTANQGLVRNAGSCSSSLNGREVVLFCIPSEYFHDAYINIMYRQYQLFL